MKHQSISKSNLKKIHDVACPTWKSKIEEFAKRDLFSDEIELSQNEVDEMFAASDEKQTKVLSKFIIKTKNRVDEINSFEDACDVLGITDYTSEISILKSSSSPTKQRLIALYKLEIIVRALNNGWYPNWDDSSECKYWNWWTMKSGFSSYLTHYHTTNTTVPSALCLKTLELAKHCAKIALKEYEMLYK